MQNARKFNGCQCVSFCRPSTLPKPVRPSTRQRMANNQGASRRWNGWWPRVLMSLTGESPARLREWDITGTTVRLLGRSVKRKTGATECGAALSQMDHRESTGRLSQADQEDQWSWRSHLTQVQGAGENYKFPRDQRFLGGDKISIIRWNSSKTIWNFI